MDGLGSKLNLTGTSGSTDGYGSGSKRGLHTR